MNSEIDYDYIDNNQALAQFCAAIESASYCVIDTEFVRESTYYPELALIQMAADGRMACIDPLVIDDFGPLAALLVKPELLKVFHSSSQDMEILYHKFGEVPTPVFDTQVAAAALGFNHQVSYADLVQQLTGVSLEKKHTRAQWTRRPLSQDEIDYAMDDVRYLVPAYEALSQQLEGSQRSSWIEKDLKAISNPELYQVNKDLLWKKLKGVQKLKGERLQIASDLCRWREDIAQRQNRPRRWIAKDDALIEMARQQPADLDALGRIPELGPKTVSRHGKTLLEILARAKTIDPADWPQHDRAKPLSRHQLALGDCLMALCRMFAEQNQLALATLATRKDIDTLILNPQKSRLSQGWRFQMAGEQLLEFIHGQAVIAVVEEQLVLQSG